MAWDGYMCLGGVEFINSSRLAQMIGAGRGPDGITCQDCAPCPDLDLGLGYPGGYNPSDMPWYDPLEPESIDFAGLLVTSVTGLNPGEFTRPVTETAGVGAIIGQGRQSAPQIVVTGLLMAATCCAAEFGLRWLRSALRGACASGCGTGVDLTVLSCVPDFPDQDCVGNAAALAVAIAACGGNAECEADAQARFLPTDYEALLAPYYRTFKNAALVAGPTVSQIIPRGCPSCYECGFTEVTFTIAASDPCMYREPIEVATAEAFVCQDPSTDCVVWVDNLDGTADCDDCPDEADCATDPNCVDVTPPSMPTITNPCVVELCEGARFCRACFTIPKGLIPNTAEGALQLNIYSGATAMRGINVRVWENPLGLSVDDLDSCDACSELNISYIGPQSTLTIDGAARTSTIACPTGSSVRANAFIASGSGSSSFTYPTLIGCGGPYTVCVTTVDGISPLAYVSAAVVAREC